MITLDATGLQIQTFEEVLADVRAAMRSQLGDDIRLDLESSYGQIAFIWAEQVSRLQEELLGVYETLSFSAEEAHLERVVALLGVTRRPAIASSVVGLVQGTPNHTIAEGTTLRYEPAGTLWDVVADTTLDGVGEASLTVAAQDVGEAHTANVGHDYTGTLANTAGGPNAIGDYTLTFAGYGLVGPVAVTYTATQPPATPAAIVEGMRQRIVTESLAGGLIAGVVVATRRVNQVLEVWTSPSLPDGTITFAATTFETPTMVFVPRQVWTVLGDEDAEGFTALELAVVGSGIEVDAALRQRAAVEAFRRGQGPLKAIEAAVTQVRGVTFVRAWENTGNPAAVDANGIPGRSINVVVEGGANAEVAEAILASRPGGVQLWGTDYDEPHQVAPGQFVSVRFDRVEEVPIWIQYSATLTAEAPPDAGAAIASALLAGAQSLFGIGDDVRPWKLYGVVKNASIPGIDDIEILVSVDNGGVPLGYSADNIEITIRRRAVFAAERIEEV